MKCGILIVGSLWWDSNTPGRADWRGGHLELDQWKLVNVPIFYGRKSSSRGDTFTMTFGRETPSGVALTVPCKREVGGINDLVEEARALWKAEAPTSRGGAIARDWGSVGVLFGSDEARALLAADWSKHFRGAGGKTLSVVTADGEFDISWPTLVDGTPVELDIILATATAPDPERPSATAVAEAWMRQSGRFESYFLENVRHGIRTADDLAIWRHIASNPPAWMNAADNYTEAFDVLRKETQGLAPN